MSPLSSNPMLLLFSAYWNVFSDFNKSILKANPLSLVDLGQDVADVVPRVAI